MFRLRVPTPHAARFLAVLALVGLLLGANVGLGTFSSARAAAGVPYLGLSAMGMPATPLPFYPASGFHVSVYDSGPMNLNVSPTGQLTAPNASADHGPNCEPPASDTSLPTLGVDTHTVTTIDQSVYVCHDHVMSALAGPGYAQASFMPPALADWADGPVTLTWSVSTFIGSDRGWWEAWLTPKSDQLELPASNQGDQVQGTPKSAIMLQECGLGAQGLQGQHGICGAVIVNGVQHNLPVLAKSVESVLTPSRQTRTQYQAVISATHITVSLPATHTVLLDSAATIPFTQAIVQLTDEEYDPLKSDACGPPADQAKLGGKCALNTFHWSDLGISNAIPFDVSHPSARFMGPGHTAANVFASPSVAGSLLAFHWIANGMSVSFDGGATFTKAPIQATENGSGGSCGVNQSLMPIPAGATSFILKASNNCYGDPWIASDFVREGPTGVVTPPTPTPSPTPVPPTPTPNPSPTPINISNQPCMLVVNNQMVNGTCSGTFTPAS
jgi:hypothetical protein